MSTPHERIATILTRACPPAYRSFVPELTQIVVHNLDQDRPDALGALQDEERLEEYCRRIVGLHRKYHPLLTRLQGKKDTGAWQDIMRRFYGWSMSILGRHAAQSAYPDRQEWAWEIAHLAGITLATARFPYDCEFEAWTYVIVRNKTMHEIRSRGTLQARLENSAFPVGDLAEIDYLLQSRGIQDKGVEADHTPLIDALGRLPQTQRLVITMHYFEDRSMPEIAAALGKSANAVYQAHFQGLKRLRQLLSVEI